MGNKLELLKIVSSVFKGITVECFIERFGGLTEYEIREFIAQQQGMLKRYKLTSEGVIAL
ncbi:MAG: hypothetical protein IJ308_08475 [Clostridia bacterium]|nr:hypothetical protein [Clostridia bacterium]